MNMSELRDLRRAGVTFFVESGLIIAAAVVMPAMARAADGSSDTPLSIQLAIAGSIVTLTGLLAWTYRQMFTRLMRALDSVEKTHSRRNRRNDDEDEDAL